MKQLRNFQEQSRSQQLLVFCRVYASYLSLWYPCNSIVWPAKFKHLFSCFHWNLLPIHEFEHRDIINILLASFLGPFCNLQNLAIFFFLLELLAHAIWTRTLKLGEKNMVHNLQASKSLSKRCEQTLMSPIDWHEILCVKSVNNNKPLWIFSSLAQCPVH